MARVAVIGAGFSGLVSASVLAAKGHAVSIFEKNAELGGRARVFTQAGFTFDMGPSWYWMPDIFDEFFAHLGESREGYYRLRRLSPAFRMVFPRGETLDIPAEFSELMELFETIEVGAGTKLKQFMTAAEEKYRLGVKELAFQSCTSLLPFIRWKLLSRLHKLHLFTPFDRYVASFFKDIKLRRLMEFPILFLGTLPQTTPALYSFMNYGGLLGGTWYPEGGMGKIVETLERVALKRGVAIHRAAPVEGISVRRGAVSGAVVRGESHACDGIIASADYHHVDQTLLPFSSRRYGNAYWKKRVLAPSAFILFLGITRKLPSLRHHTLFFDADFESQARALTTSADWPEDPLFYVCAPSKSDESIAPAGCENLFVLVPLAAGLPDTEERRQKLRARILARLASYCGHAIEPFICVERSYALKDFSADYNAFRGNAYGLANTLWQTAFGKPQMRSSKVRRLVYAGQLTVPGPGIPPAIISGRIAAAELHSQLGRVR